ncbi:hypothetical protein PM033_17455 [Halorubrum ezzemoulense]|uniref:hypothetical protein n=1 Tax=Halorubrum TaxID=56688 RepID=UPI0010F80D4B|nr:MULTISPECIES: hypothetical protein [Halorubrum]MDB2253510.1 hypothetical protein [Halorubrum ezzemoulense]TKX63965.1 hypothetical protein EXE47_13505 [Halorubrum sp. GN12_10-3_MGM]
MNTIGRLKRAIKSPRLFLRGVNRAYHRRGGLRTENTTGIDVFDEDWDTLVVLDACRYDMFKEVNHIEGSLTAKESKASSTPEWLRANVHGRNLRDTVYLTANPQLERNRENWDVDFYEVINVWLDEGWDEETGTVLADTMTEAAITAHKQFPQKRIVVHYMQPHYPFVQSDTAFDKEHLASIESGEDEATGQNVWAQKFTGELDQTRSELWDVYTANLEYVLKHVEDLLTEIPGKTVITSDHGNYVGEHASPIPIREYGHPRGLYDEPVTRIPWLEVIQGGRREIQTGVTSEMNEEVDTDRVTERLKDLGYRD